MSMIYLRDAPIIIKNLYRIHKVNFMFDPIYTVLALIPLKIIH